MGIYMKIKYIDLLFHQTARNKWEIFLLNGLFVKKYEQVEVANHMCRVIFYIQNLEVTVQSLGLRRVSYRGLYFND